MSKLEYIFFRIVHCYLNIQLLKHILDLNSDKNLTKMKRKLKKKKENNLTDISLKIE